MGMGYISLGLGQYLTLYTIIAIIIIGILGYFFGTLFGGVVVFVVVGIAAVIILYAVLSRFWRWLLHGSTSAGGSQS